MLVYAVNIYVSFACIIRLIDARCGESEEVSAMGIVSWPDEEVSVDAGERSGIRYGPCRALAPVDGVGEQGMVGDGRRQGEAGRSPRRIPPVGRRGARDAGADDRRSPRACRWQSGGQ